MNFNRKSVKAFVLLMFLYVTGCVICALPVICRGFMTAYVFALYHIILSICLVVYFAHTIVSTRFRTYLISTGVMISFFFLLQIMKYVCFKEIALLERLCWYAYYIPVLIIPQFSLAATLEIDRPKNRKKSLLPLVTGIVAVAFAAIVLTNDFHQSVFRFEDGLANWNVGYSYGFMYFVILAQNCAVLLFSFVVCIKKCSVSACKRRVFAVVVYAALFVIWLILTALEKRPELFGEKFGEFAETFCFLTGGIWVLMINIGIVRSNIGYGKLLSHTSLAVQIIDSDYSVKYRSASAMPLTKEQMQAETPITINGNIRVFGSPVSGGYAFYQTDISELNELNGELESIREALLEESEIIRLENELEEKREKIKAKSELYDRIASKILPQLHVIEGLVKEAKNQPERFDINIKYISIYAVYVKRMSNLMILASENDTLEQTELFLSLKESAIYLRRNGLTVGDGMGETSALVPSERVIEAYELFETMTEEALGKMYALDIALFGDRLSLVFEGAKITPPEKDFVTVEYDEGTSYVRIYLKRGEVK